MRLRRTSETPDQRRPSKKRSQTTLAVTLAISFAAPALANARPSLSAHHAPPHVAAWYMGSASGTIEGLRATAYDKGYTFARNHPGGTRVLVLDFGAARKLDANTWGVQSWNVTADQQPIYWTNAEVLSALKAAANGHHNGCLDRPGGCGAIFTVILYGNNNSYMSNNSKMNMSQSDAYWAGYYQSQRATDLFLYQQSQGYNQQSANAASDMEPDWDGPAITKKLVEGASAEGTSTYYNFGSADGCPESVNPVGSNGPCHNGWSVSDVGYVSYHGVAVPLPEIYHAPWADQWTVVRRWWDANNPDNLVFFGSTGTVGLAGILTPREGWHELAARNELILNELICITWYYNSCGTPTSINHFELDPAGDAYVDQSVPNGNFGSSTEIRVSSRLRQTGEGAPLNVAPPTAGGVYVPGGTLVAHPGTWTGAEPMAFNYLWSWCDGGEIDNWCWPSPGAKYKIIDPLYDARMRNLRLNTVATNAAGVSDKLVVLPNVGSPQTPPVNVEQPKVFGIPEVGRSLEATEGLWYAPTSTQFSFRWFSCVSPGATGCVERTGTGGQYLVAEADAGRMIRADVRADPVPGSTSPITVSTSYVTVPGVPPSPIVQTRNGLLQFLVEASAPVLRATLTLCALDSTASGGEISVLRDSFWDEGTVTWDTAPTGGQQFASLGPVVAGFCYDVDVTNMIFGAGIYTFRISSSTPTDVRYASKESSSGSPLLVIDTLY